MEASKKEINDKEKVEGLLKTAHPNASIIHLAGEVVKLKAQLKLLRKSIKSPRGSQPSL